MAHPSEFYTRYFLAMSEDRSEESVDSLNDVLTALRLPTMESYTFDEIKAKFRPPAGFANQNRSHKPTIEFMKAQEIYTLWDPTPEVKEVMQLNFHPQVRETIQLLLMPQVISAKEISMRVDRKHKFRVHPHTVDAFRHYFWNVGRCSIENWIHLLRGQPFQDHYYAALTGSRAQALWRAGFNPEIDGHSALQEVHRALFMRIDATRSMPDTKTTAQMLTSLTKEMLAVHSVLFGDGGHAEKHMEELRRFNMQRTGTKPKPLLQLVQNGSYSNDGRSDEGS